MKCPTVAYDSATFSTDVLSSLGSSRVFSLVNLPEALKEAIGGLVQGGNDFFDTMHTYDAEEFAHTIGANNISGLIPAKKPLMWCNNAARFYISINSQGGFDNQKIPLMDGKPVLAEAAKVFHKETDRIIERVLNAIAQHYKVDPKELSEPILGSAMISLSRYYPITQRRAAQMFQDKVLVVDGNRVEQFANHVDICPVTILYYPVGTKGLLVEDLDTKEMVPLTVDEQVGPSLIIFTGRILKELTGGYVGALKHQVVTCPEEQHQEAKLPPHQWRFTLAKFTYFNKPELQPLTTAEGAPLAKPDRKHQRQYPITQASFFKEYLKSSGEHREQTRVTEFPLAIAEKYPTEVTCREMYTAQLGADTIGPYTLGK